MAYCKECGAYVPDGHTKCLACGDDQTKAAEQTAQAQAYDYKYEEPKSSASDFLREELEKQRRRQQENSRKWAETEKAQRERAKQNVNINRSTDTKKYAAPTNLSTSKILSALSYLGILFILPYIFADEDDFAKFHAKQGLILFVASVIADIAASIFGLGWIVTIAKLFFIYKGISNVLKGVKEKLPYIGNLF